MYGMIDFALRYLLRQKLLRKMEVDAREGEAPVCDVYMKKETEYEIRGWLPKKAGAIELSLKNPSGASVPVAVHSRGFALVAPENDVYQVWVNIRSVKGEGPSGRMIITVNSGYPVPNWSSPAFAGIP